tara:strand:+ start:1701 stop:3413 length:1713 start_codon:yes stop_codon:yes gene_type:complete
MPFPNSSNRDSFKAFLRAHRKKFTSGIQTCLLGEMTGVMSSVSAGIDTSQVISVVLFESGERVGIDTIFSNQGLFYVPAMDGDYIVLGIGSETDRKSHRLKFDSSGVTYENQSFGLDDVISLGSDLSLTVKGIGGALFQSGNAPTYTVGTSSTSIQEGGTVNFTVNTTDVGAGTTLYYSILGNTDDSDFTDNVQAGYFNIVSTGSTTGVGTITKTAANDALVNEITEAFKVIVSTGSTLGPEVGRSSLVKITNLGLPSYTITPSAASVNEGSSVSFTVNTVNVTGPLYYSTNGTANAADFTDNSLTGSFSLVSTGSTTGVGTIIRSIATDFDTESGEQFSITVRTGSTSGPGVTTSSNVTIGDVTPTVNVSESATSVDEGGSVTFTISGSNIPDGAYYYTIYEEDGTVASTDFNPANLNGSFSVSNNSGSITITIAEDITSEGPDKFKIQIRTGSISGTVIAESSAITINDTSRTPGSTANGLTFGPVQVNRDGGTVANATDWYDICNIDTLPEGSSIALFIDTSGSMTMATVQASYDAFVAKLNEKNITITTVTNSNEDWITPFLVDLP